MTAAVRKIVEAYAIGSEKECLSQLTVALKQLPVLAIRKYAYEHAFAYFSEQLARSTEEFEAWCDEIELLVKGYTTIQYRAMKLAMTKDLKLLDIIFQKIDEQDERELKIKRGLLEYFQAWHDRVSCFGEGRLGS
ncbi:hypothetical protein LR68_01107 [Anoxybacillus sp. BCO1]|nr:hypothetical protein LR68_01107 [Anoxybacillus sp. BCO1]